MIKFSAFKLLIIIILFTNSLFSQWYKLPTITSIPSYTSPPMGPMQLNYPVDILPIGNNTIVWTLSALVSPSSGGYINDYISKNDLSSSSCIESCNYSSSYGCCGISSLSGFNDSSYTYVSTYQGWYAQVFKLGSSLVTQSVTCPGGNSIIHLAHVTINSAYAISQLNYVNDTLLLVRTLSGMPKIQFLNKLPKYLTGYNKKLFFINDSTGYLNVNYRNNSSKQTLLKTVNFGSSWSEIYLDSVNTIVDFDFPTENIGYLTKNNGTILKTTDGGTNWLTITNSGISYPKCIKFSDSQNGYIAGNTNILKKTIDGGNTWTYENSGTPNTINAIQTFGNVAYFVDHLKNVYKNQQLISVLEENTEDNVIQIFPNPANNLFTIKANYLKEGTFNIEVSNMIGQTVYASIEKAIGKDFSKSITLENIENGSYIIIIKQGYKTYNKKLLVSKN